MSLPRMQLLTLLLVTGSVSSQVSAQRKEVPVSPAGTETTLRQGPSIPPGWREDPTRRRREWAAMLGGEEYLGALAATGMADALKGSRAGAPPEGAASWTRTGPVGGFGLLGDNGRVSGLEILQSGATTYLYAGACGGGLWRTDTTNLGVWQSLGDNLPNPSVRAFAVHPSNLQRIVVGTGDWTRYQGAGMFLTTNGGASWSAITLAVTPGHFYRIRHALNAPQVMVAASDNGLWRSMDSGGSWTAVETGHWTDLVLHPTDANRMYAVRMGTGVYRSTNQGASWTLLSSPNLPATANWGRSSLAICRDFPATVAMMVVNNSNLFGVYRSLDGGTTWNDVTSNLAGVTFGGGQANHAQALAFRPTDRDELFLGTDSIARSWWNSSTNRLEWKIHESAAGMQIGHADITQLVFSPLTGDQLLWIGNDGGLFRCLLGSGTWTVNGNTSSGLAISQIDGFDADGAMAGLGLQDNGQLRSTDSAQSWSRVSIGDGGALQITDAVHLDMWWWAGMPWSALRCFFGQNPEGVPTPASSALSFHYDARADRVWVAADKKLYSTSESAPTVSWTEEISGGLHTDPSYELRALWGSKLESGTLFVSFGWGLDGDVAVVHKVGSSWDINLATNLSPTGWVWSVSPSSEWPGECWACLHGAVGTPKILHTTDYGESWQDVSGTLSAVATVFAVAPTPFDPRVLYAATNLGVYQTQDAGQSWQPFQTGMPIVEVRGLAFVADDAHSSTHKLRAGTYGRGTWERDIVGAPIVYVDRDYVGIEAGTFQRPWSSVAEGVAAAPSGAIVAVRSNTYYEPQVVAKNVLIMSFCGSSVIR